MDFNEAGQVFGLYIHLARRKNRLSIALHDNSKGHDLFIKSIMEFSVQSPIMYPARSSSLPGFA